MFHSLYPVILPHWSTAIRCCSLVASATLSSRFGRRARSISFRSSGVFVCRPALRSRWRASRMSLSRTMAASRSLSRAGSTTAPFSTTCGRLSRSRAPGCDSQPPLVRRVVVPQPQPPARSTARSLRSWAAPTACRAPTRSSTRRQCARPLASTLACATAVDACATAPATAARSAKRRFARPPVSTAAPASRPIRATAPMQRDKASRCTAASARAIAATAFCRRRKRCATTATASRATVAPTVRQRRSIPCVDRRLARATSPSSAAAPQSVRRTRLPTVRFAGQLRVHATLPRHARAPAPHVRPIALST
jgi:hypothetical protein